MKRRKFLIGGGAVFAVGAGGFAWSRRSSVDLSNIASRPRLAMPPLIDATQTGRFELVARAGTTKFLKGAVSQTAGFNQPYLGPVIRLKTGDVAVRLENQTQQPVSAHWHGMLVPGEVDGGPHQSVAPGGMWEPVLPVDQAPATAWYHTHIHGATATGVYAGLAGGLIVSDGKDDQRGLPVTYGEDDLYLVLQDKSFSGNGTLAYDRGMMSRMHGFAGDTVVVNGQIDAVAEVPRGIVRLRLVNGSNARIYRLRFSDGRPMHLVATDGGYIPEPVSLNTLRLSPGERAEVLVDFSLDASVALTSLRDPNAGVGGMMGQFQGLGAQVLGQEFEVLSFAPQDNKARIGKVPDKLDGHTPDLKGQTIAARRSFSLDVGMGGGMMGGGMMGGGMASGGMAINGRSFDETRLDFTVRHGTVEHWIVSTNTLTHPFHVHGAAFQVISENGGAPRPENSGWKDTVLVENEVELLVRFDQPAPRHAPFMFHCHILEHEDAGMMGQFSVV